MHGGLSRRARLRVYGPVEMPLWKGLNWQRESLPNLPWETFMLCSIGFIAKHYGVSPSTIRRWVKLGYIRIAGRTFGGHRRFDVPNEVSSEQASTRKHIGYARVIVPRSKGGFGPTVRAFARGRMRGSDRGYRLRAQLQQARSSFFVETTARRTREEAFRRT